MFEKKVFDRDLLDFLSASVTPWHAVREMTQRLDDAGFTHLDEGEQWQLQPGQGYYLTRNDSSLIAWRQPEHEDDEAGWRMLGAHTDSPCLRVKPNPELNRNGYFQLGVEVYGGALLNPWFDRDLSLAGRVSWEDDKAEIHHSLVNFDRAIAIIPSLAIHLDREANKNRQINAQTYLPPLLGQLEEGEKADFKALLAAQLTQQGEASVERVLDYELCFYDTQPAAMVGLNEEFLASARLDNLLSCYVGLKSLLTVDAATAGQVLICNDHEEVGSCSTSGAQGPMLKQWLDRLVPDAQKQVCALSKSMLISADNAHGVHPNFADRHDENHGPLLNHGPVIKVNANQRYATNSETSAVFRQLAAKEELPVQSFVVRTDMACGSTIGPLTAGEIGVRTLDIGIPQFAMHSIREMAGSEDAYILYRILLGFLQRKALFQGTV